VVTVVFAVTTGAGGYSFFKKFGFPLDAVFTAAEASDSFSFLSSQTSSVDNNKNILLSSLYFHFALIHYFYFIFTSSIAAGILGLLLTCLFF